MRSLNIETATHGRVLIEDAADSFSRRWLIGFHGYGQSAEDMLAELRRLNAGGWSLAVPQALHRFYTRDGERVIASWMTRQDREDAVADNVRYVNALVGSHLELQRPGAAGDARIVYIGFSQGAAMAYRAAVLGGYRAAAVIALGGDMPPEVRAADRGLLRERLSRVLIGAGTRDTWFTPAKMEAEAGFLASVGVPHEIVRFDGGHEWTDDLRAAVRKTLDELRATEDGRRPDSFVNMDG